MTTTPWSPPSILPQYGGDAAWNDAWRSVKHDSTNDNASAAAIVDFTKTAAFHYPYALPTPTGYTVWGTVTADTQGVYQPVLYAARPYTHLLQISQNGQLLRDMRPANAAGASGPTYVKDACLTNWMGRKIAFYCSEGTIRIDLSVVGNTGSYGSPNDDIWGSATSNGKDVFYCNELRAHGPVPGFVCQHENGTNWGMNLTWDYSIYGVEWAADTNLCFVWMPVNHTIAQGLYCHTVLTGAQKWVMKGLQTHGLVVYGGNLYSNDATSLVCRRGLDGSVLWSYATNYPARAIGNGVVVTQTSATQMVGLNAATGAIMWAVPIPRLDGVAVAKGSNTIILVSYASGSNYALSLWDLKTGKKLFTGPQVSILWGYNTTGPQPILLGNRVLFGDARGITAFDSPAASTTIVPLP